MPDIRSAFTLGDGPLVPVRVSLPWSVLLTQRQAGRATAQPVDVSALIDTGAEVTCLDLAIVRRLGLPFFRMGLTNVPALGGIRPTTEYEAGVYVLHPSGDTAQHLRCSQMLVLGLSLNAVRYDAIIGRDILAQCVLTCDGPAGAFTLTY